MKSATSCSDRRLFYPVLWKKNMARFWPIWSVYGACWLLAMPLNLLMLRAEDTYGSMLSPQYFADLEVLSMITPGSVIAALVFGILSAMAVFSYLYNSRSVGLFHALPVRREGLFLTNYLSGLSFMLLPSLVVFFCTLLAELAKGCPNIGALCMWLAMQVLLTLFFYSFAVFCAMFTGHILALPAFYGILSVLAVVMVQLVNEVLRAFVFGYRYVDTLNTLGTWLSPVILFLEKLRVDRAWDTDGNLERAVFQGLGYGLIYALIGAALAAVAWCSTAGGIWRGRETWSPCAGCGPSSSMGWLSALRWRWACSSTCSSATTCPKGPGRCCASWCSVERWAILPLKCCSKRAFGSFWTAGRAVWRSLPVWWS